MKKKLIIIAEAGVNHNGKLKNALKLVDIAAEAKADYVKFQTYITDEIVQKNFSLAKYQRVNTNFKNQYAMLKKLQLNESDFIKIKKRCIKKKIKFLSSPFDIKSIQFLNKLRLKTFKVPSGEITNIPYLEKLGKLKKEIILSTGMANEREIKEAIKILVESGTKKKNISLLHCNTEYPVALKKINLNSIKYLKKKFGLNIGFSDHSLGNEAALIAVGLGIKIIEKHFTIDKSMKGPDHKASLNKKELIEFVFNLRQAEESLGKFQKKPSSDEIDNARFVRKNIVARTNIFIGQKFSSTNLTTKRSVLGIPASEWKKVINKISRYNFKKNETIRV